MRTVGEKSPKCRARLPDRTSVFEQEFHRDQEVYPVLKKTWLLLHRPSQSTSPSLAEALAAPSSVSPSRSSPISHSPSTNRALHSVRSVPGSGLAQTHIAPCA